MWKPVRWFAVRTTRTILTPPPAAERVVWVVALAFGASAQQVPPRELVIRATTRLIQLNVIVHDKRGQLVRDLKKEDFTIFDNGKPRQAAFFSQDSGTVLPQAAKLPPNIFSNRLGQSGAVPSGVTVILIDELNTRFHDQAWSKRQVIKYLSTIHPEDRIAVYALGSGLRVLHDFTTDSSDLLRKLAKYSGSVTAENFAADEAGKQFEAWMNGMGDAAGQEADFYTMNRAEGTLHALEFIGNHLASLPGRKNLIWVSGGFPLQIGFDSIEAMRGSNVEQRTFGREMERAVNALNDGNVAIYPVDARGLVTPPDFDTGNKKFDAAPKASVNPVAENQHTMSLLADRTGGRAWYNTNDLSRAIREAVDDSTVTYTLGFYPAHGDHDGKFHKLQVKTSAAGLNLSYRKGYFDTQEKVQDARVRAAELRSSVWSPLEFSAVGLTVEVAPPDPARAEDLNIYVTVDPAAIGLTASGDNRDGMLDILFMQKSENGNQFQGEDARLTLILKPDDYRKLQQEGLLYHRFIRKSPQGTQLRVLVRDASSGSLGSVTVPFDQVRQ